ncbi:MAG TPA: EamA family transporter, partial [Burkholderiaceae bacterium]|nr:EamA family transporter [Burkholderiaceae bacterium]
MKARDLFDFTLLAALWGASFLFTRIAVPAFGPLAIANLRTAVAALVLLSLLLWRGGAAELAPNALRFLLLGAFNSAIPFTLFAYAVL